MKIEHFAMYVLDLEGAKDFFVRYFDATPNELYHNKQTGFKSYFLSFGDGSRLEVMTRPRLAKSKASSLRYGYIHLAFGVSNDEAVDALTERLRGYKWTKNHWRRLLRELHLRSRRQPYRNRFPLPLKRH